MNKPLFATLLAFWLATAAVNAQFCFPRGNQTTYGTNNVWRGYVYNSTNFTNYAGYVEEGSYSSPDFDESFGGSDHNYSTNGCAVQTESFSVRYKLTKTFSNNTYDFTISGDDGYRFSLDGGATWVINRWSDQSYTTTTYSVALNGTYHLVLEYYENSGDNRITFSIGHSCMSNENTNEYGTGNVWRGYVYDNDNFTSYKGMVLQGAAGNASFDQDFGGSDVYLPTTGCDVETETFSVRYRLRRSFPLGLYLFTVKGDDGYRLSLDGGVTWVINKWSVQSLLTSVLSLVLNGSYNMVLEYYESTGENRVTFSAVPMIVLPVGILSFTGKEQNDKAVFDWEIASGGNAIHYTLEQSMDGAEFKPLTTVSAASGISSGTGMRYQASVAIPGTGNYYYRLKITEASGTITYSNVITLHFASGSTTTVQVFPTIVTGHRLFVKTSNASRQLSIRIADISGRTVTQPIVINNDSGGIHTVDLPPNLRAGIYILRVENSGKSDYVQKIVVQ